MSHLDGEGSKARTASQRDRGLARRRARATCCAAMEDETPRATKEEVARLIDDIPLARFLRVRVDELGMGRALLTLPSNLDAIRAGGTVSGPAIMALADSAVYAAVLTRIGLEPMAVTSDLSVRFLRRPPLEDLHAEASVIHLGRRNAVAEVRMWSSDPGRLVAHAPGT
jgi:uncharacterized protein (TIGR00369 family)